VSNTAPQPPLDIDTLRALLAAAWAERDAAIAERDQALSQNDRLRHLLRQLQRAQGALPAHLPHVDVTIEGPLIVVGVVGVGRPAPGVGDRGSRDRGQILQPHRTSP
jgi:hypothetical protein